MQKQLFRLIAAFLTIFSVATYAVTLKQQVDYCMEQLGFSSFPAVSCMANNTYRTVQGANNGDSEFLGYLSLKDTVDAVYHCQHVNEVTRTFTELELTIHNRISGKTCFFRDNQRGEHSVDVVSLTDTHADDFWVRGSTSAATRTDGCISCHTTGGPYLIGQKSAAAMAHFGLINDGHDTLFQRMQTVNADKSIDPTTGRTIEQLENDRLKSFLPTRCANGCHALRDSSTLQFVISDLELLNLMPPDADNSPYRWINRDIPSTDGMEAETFTSAASSFPVTQYCGVPTLMEVHAVGSDNIFSSNSLAGLPDKLQFFNLREGLVCVDTNQPSGHCKDYSVQYQCGDGSWTQWYDKDDPGPTVDNERRSQIQNLCVKNGVFLGEPISITARYNQGTPQLPQYAVFNGPNDRLAQLTPYALICNTVDQPNGEQCSNYVVRFQKCINPAQATMTKIKSAWTLRFLNTTNTANDAETRGQSDHIDWPSQDWVIEYAPNGNTIRVKDVWSNKYLTASSSNEQAIVVVHNFDSALLRQQWIIETIAGSNEVRLKNVGSNRYLTIGDVSNQDYAPIYSQGLNTAWASQRWVLQ